MKKIITILFATSLFLMRGDQTFAAKKRPPRGTRPPAPVKRTTSTSGSRQGAKASVRFRSDRLALILSFSDFGEASSVTYTLTYYANGVAQGARSTVTPESGGGQRELLFGTCSRGVCRYHGNITNARLIIDSQLPSGFIIRKPYRIKV